VKVGEYVLDQLNGIALHLYDTRIQYQVFKHGAVVPFTQVHRTQSGKTFIGDYHNGFYDGVIIDEDGIGQYRSPEEAVSPEDLSDEQRAQVERCVQICNPDY